LIISRIKVYHFTHQNHPLAAIYAMRRDSTTTTTRREVSDDDDDNALPKLPLVVHGDI